MGNRTIFRTAGIAIVVAAMAATGCSGGGVWDGLLPGDLVITEVFPNPPGIDSDGVEWFEVFNATDRTLEMSGLDLVAGRADGSGRDYHLIMDVRIDPGQYMVFGNVKATQEPPAWVDYGYGSGLNLRNTGGMVSIECEDVTVDRVVFADVEDGVSTGFHGSIAPDMFTNDDLDKWCPASTPFDEGSYGSPGAANEPCDGFVPTNSCEEGGEVRQAVPPQVGDLSITEIMANPGAVLDSAGEWFEVLVNRAVDLNGLHVGVDLSKNPKTLNNDECLHFEAGAHVLFARKADPAENGGLPEVDFELSFQLSNSPMGDGEGLYIEMNDVILDIADYQIVEDGAATSLDPVTGKWCVATDVYGDGDTGTPGAANPSCSRVE